MSTADQLRQDINRLSAQRGDGMSTAALATALASEGWVKPAPVAPGAITPEGWAPEGVWEDWWRGLTAQQQEAVRAVVDPAHECWCDA